MRQQERERLQMIYEYCHFRFCDIKLNFYKRHYIRYTRNLWFLYNFDKSKLIIFIVLAISRPRVTPLACADENAMRIVR